MNVFVFIDTLKVRHLKFILMELLNVHEKSFLTLIFYLNDDFKGGETAFFHYRGSLDNSPLRYQCTPKQGNALIFDHKQLHEGSEVTEGVKYVLRTDVMYEVL